MASQDAARAEDEAMGLTSGRPESGGPSFSKAPCTHDGHGRRWLWPLAATALALSALACLALFAGEAALPRPGPPQPRPELRGNASEAAPRQLTAACDRLAVRLDELGRQDLAGAAGDPMFPDSALSIAKGRGARCGDAAVGLRGSCGKYDHWASFEDVARRMRAHFHVLGARGPRLGDVGRGELGTCYFLSALAAVAHADPTALQRMFVHRSRWAQKVYTTRWLLDGTEVNVEVDDQIPAQHGSGPFFGAGPFFVRPSDAGEWWPVILEKAWAKIYGSFHAVEGGLWLNAVQAMTKAPVLRSDHGRGRREVFALLQEATAQGWPMGAATGARCGRYGLSRGHVFAVLAARRDPVHGDVVQLYNPWSTDRYRGAVPNAEAGDGIFSMRLEEYHDAFRESYVAKARKGYKLALRTVQTAAKGLRAWEVRVRGRGPFYATLSWPGQRMLKHCEASDPSATLLVLRKGSTRPLAVAPRQHATASATSLEVQAGPGEYIILAGLDFPARDKVHEGHLLVHSAEAASIEPSAEDAGLLFAKVFGPTDARGGFCPVVSISSLGIFQLREDRAVRGFPSFWSRDGADFAYWTRGQWHVAEEASWQSVLQGTHRSSRHIAKADMSCGCADSQGGVPGFRDVRCDAVAPRKAKFGNVQCQNSQFSALVQRYCPVTCGVPECIVAAIVVS